LAKPSERSAETFSVLRTKTYLVHSIEPTNLFGSLCRRGAAATCKIPKDYLCYCLAYFMQLVFAGSESGNCFCRRNLCP